VRLSAALILSVSLAATAKDAIYKERDVSLSVNRLQTALKVYREQGPEAFIHATGAIKTGYEKKYWLGELRKLPSFPAIKDSPDFIFIWDRASNSPLALIPKSHLQKGVIRVNGEIVFFPATKDSISLHEILKDELFNEGNRFVNLGFIFPAAWASGENPLAMILTMLLNILKGFGQLVSNPKGFKDSMSPEDPKFHAASAARETETIEALYGYNPRDSFTPDLKMYGQGSEASQMEKAMRIIDGRTNRGEASLGDRDGTYSKSSTKPTGYCWRYVKLALMESGMVKGYMPGTSAKYAGLTLERNGFKKCPAIRDPNKAPLASVLVYGGGTNGHIEMRTLNGFTSDFIARVRTTAFLRSRPLLGVYVKGQACPV
jgi:hypothetical protein